MVTQREDPIRAQLIEARRNQILEAAARVFAERGFHRATTREIAETAGVSEGTIYNYFGGKEDLLVAIMARLGDTVKMVMRVTPELLEQVLSLDLREYMVKLFEARFEFVAENAPMLKAVTSEMLIDEAFAEQYYEQFILTGTPTWEKHVQTRMEQGDMRSFDPALFTRYLFALHFGLLGLFLIGDPVIKEMWGSDEMVEQTVDLFLNGVVPREASSGGGEE